MDYKEKVIALLRSQELSEEQKEKLENIFPELKDYKDERIRKAIKKALQVRCGGSRIISDEPVTLEEAIAWLEKQGEQTRDELSQQEVTKTSDQEPPDKVEPKKLEADKVIEWLEANIINNEYFVK